MPRTKSIGVFDSGFGGLTILRGLVRELPEYNYIYLGDTARTPYGSRSQEVIYEFTRQAVTFLFEHDCDLVILACNTASSEALRRIQQEYLPKHHPDKNVLGVIIPAAEAASEKTRTKKIGVIATEQTVLSQAFVRELHKLDPTINVFQNACPLLVPIIENGEHRGDIADITLQKYLTPLLKKNIDTLILGCTHYGILEKKIKKIVGKNIAIISEATVVGKKLRNYLSHHKERERALRKNHGHTFYTTDLTEKFQRLGSEFFGTKIHPKKAVLEED
jgi:glutamate racemase